MANSPLVKTAIAGEDANWGRIVMAVGKAGEPADRDKLSIGVGGVWMARDGGVVPDYDEAPVVQHMKGREVEIAIDLGLGRGKATVWTCDLTHGYIDINGSYRQLSGSRLGPGRDQALQRIRHRAEPAAPADQRLHDDLARRAPQDPAPKLAVLAIERDDFLVFLALHAVVQFDDHLDLVEFCPTLQQHQIGDLEGETHRHIRRDQRHVHRGFHFLAVGALLTLP